MKKEEKQHPLRHKEKNYSNNLDSLTKELNSVGNVDGNYVGKFRLLLKANIFSPSEKEVPLLLKHVLQVYLIFVIQLCYTGFVSWYMYLHPTILIKILSVLFSLHGWVFIIISLLLMFLLWIAQGIDSLVFGMAAIISFTTVIGTLMGLVPIIYDKNLITEAFLLTIVIFVSSALFGLLTKNNLTGWSTPLFGGLLALILLGFFQNYYHNSLIVMLILVADIIVFTLYTAYDNQMIKIRFLNKLRDDTFDSNKSWWLLAMSSSISIYLDFINLLLDILNLLGDDDD